jgi:hypothetical protein
MRDRAQDKRAGRITGTIDDDAFSGLPQHGKKLEIMTDFPSSYSLASICTSPKAGLKPTRKNRAAQRARRIEPSFRFNTERIGDLNAAHAAVRQIDRA